jgi:hypothetical protein
MYIPFQDSVTMSREEWQDLRCTHSLIKSWNSRLGLKKTLQDGTEVHTKLPYRSKGENSIEVDSIFLKMLTNRI